MLRSWVGGVSVAALVLAMTGCTNDAGTEDGEHTSLASVMGWDSDGGEDTWEDDQRAIEEAVAACMRDEGWEYIPVDTSVQFSEYSDEDELERLGREGFGITYYTLYGDSDAYVDDWVDPNEDYVASLDGAEMEAYYASLYGSEEEIEATQTLEIDPETGEEYYISEGYGTGCQGEAYELIEGDGAAQSEEMWDALDVYYEELEQRAQADPRVQAAEEDWVQCISDAGHDFDSQEQLWEDGWNDIQTRHDEILGDDYYRDPFEGMTDAQIEDFMSSATQEELEEMWDVTVELTADQEAQLEALLEEEASLAVADFECSNAMWTELEDTYAELEEQFVLEHQDELNALAAQFGTNDEP